MNVNDSMSKIPAPYAAKDGGETRGASGSGDFMRQLLAAGMDPEKLRYNSARERASRTGDEAVEQAVEQAAASGGDFWLNLRNMIVENAREKQDQAEEDAALEMLDKVLESMAGREDSREAAAQLRLEMLLSEVKQR